MSEKVLNYNNTNDNLLLNIKSHKLLSGKIIKANYMLTEAEQSNIFTNLPLR